MAFGGFRECRSCRLVAGVDAKRVLKPMNALGPFAIPEENQPTLAPQGRIGWLLHHGLSNFVQPFEVRIELCHAGVGVFRFLWPIELEQAAIHRIVNPAIERKPADCFFEERFRRRRVAERHLQLASLPQRFTMVGNLRQNVVQSASRFRGPT